MRLLSLISAICLIAIAPISVDGKETKIAGFVEPLPQPSVACKNYRVTNQTPYKVRIRFDNLDNESYELNSGDSVTYNKTLYCSSPAYVVAEYYNGEIYKKIGTNIALDLDKSDFVITESGRYVFLIPSGTSIPAEFQ